MKVFFPLVIFTFTLSNLASSQIQPPDFKCVRGDTLFWDLPSNSCGTFNSYDIFISPDPCCNFTLLASVTDPAQDFFFHPNPGGQTWHYYLTSNLNCPGQTVLHSDTLDNKPPVVSPIRSASVENGQVVLNWQPSPSPEVFAYVIYRETPIGVVPIDTVFGGTTFTDPNSSPELQPESYFVNALDRCGNTSIFDTKHSTMLLEATVEGCSQTATLTWNAYQGWKNGIGAQELWLSLNGAAPILAANQASGITTIIYDDLKDGDTYCFFIRAIEAGTGEAAKSNEICLTAEVTQPVTEFFIKNVTVTPANEVEVTWVWNTSAELKEVKILRSNQNSNYQTIDTQTPPPPPLPAQNTFLDVSVNPSAGSIFYQIETTDLCDTVAVSTYGSTIHLAAAPQGNTNLLTWSAFDLENAVVTGYDVYQILGGAETKIGSTGSGELTFPDPVDPTNPDEAQACYFIVATATLTAPGGETFTIESRSNTACAEQSARILTPNAFAPKGFNQEFKPLIVLGDLASFDMKIFDRYGQVVFHSTSPDDGWNGKKDGKDMAQGTYVFFIQVRQANGKVAEKSGVVLLLR